MKKTSLFIILISIFLFLNRDAFGQIPNLIWAKSAGRIYDDYVNDIALDSLGNVYIAGTFASDSIAFGNFVLWNANGFTTNTTDIFIAKYDPNGNVIWAKRAGTSSSESVTGIVTDASGNFYITGYFRGTTFSLDSLTLNNSAFANEIYVAKFDSTGSILWARSASGYGAVFSSDYSYTITIDYQGNVLIAGSFFCSTLNFGSYTLTNTGGSSSNSDAFVTKYDSNGNVIWATSVQGKDNENINKIATDGSGNIYASGSFQSDTLNCGSYDLFNLDTITNTTDNFLIKFDGNGNVIWAKHSGGKKSDYFAGVYSDPNGNLTVTGGFESDTISFDSFYLINNGTVGTRDIFIARYDSTGNVIWINGFGGTAQENWSPPYIDINGMVYVSGQFKSDSLYIDSWLLINNFSGTSDGFFAKFDGNGNVEYASSFGGNLEDSGGRLILNTLDYIYLTGYFESPSIVFGSNFLYNNFSSYYTADLFLAKFNALPVGLKGNKVSNELYIFPNPSNDIFFFNKPCQRIEIFSSSGELILSEANTKQVDLNAFANGLYLVRINNEFTTRLLKN